ncbi:MAG: ferritin-like domain-containing protein, partial [Acidimicrobiales bacterium]
KLALMLEEIAAQTYLKALPVLKSKDAITLAGSIFAVDQEHQAILLFALGKYPVPVVFVQTDKAATPA